MSHEMKMIEITSRTNPRVKELVRLRNGRKRRAAGVVLAEGVREVSRAVMAGLVMREIYVCETMVGKDDAVKAGVDEILSRVMGREDGVKLFGVNREVMEKVSYVDGPEGLLAIFEAPNWGLDKLVSGAVDGEVPTEGGVYLVCVQMEKPGNVGAMVRTAAAAGVDAVIAANTAGYPVDVLHPNAIRTSTAAVFDLPTVSADEEEVIAWLVENRVRILAATPAGAVDYREADYGKGLEADRGNRGAEGIGGGGGIAIVIGPEDRGLSNMWLEAADKYGGQRVVIPNKSGIVDSLNASNAAAVLMYEAMRQRGE
ncbi:23S rRNA (uridine(2479)-2'-O)-methyltransferase [Poriferisphaera corsica]|uniref:23S rRNA (Uridine(2479)-2'-O)-methyltransferase n=1 Tax=Poriferisphaera corsica TaxID=2528020 RepID=A0A517YQ57_9BACT|nr:TrmH family RNA methyltransferase [Poriferisphaera corsica]QDU32364.1 23S rRNA (uridine(2479)-2'-O)-methyltransferase [Poriferisphaera corsica]